MAVWERGMDSRPRANPELRSGRTVFTRAYRPLRWVAKQKPCVRRCIVYPLSLATVRAAQCVPRLLWWLLGLLRAEELRGKLTPPGLPASLCAHYPLPLHPNLDHKVPCCCSCASLTCPRLVSCNGSCTIAASFNSSRSPSDTFMSARLR